MTRARPILARIAGAALAAALRVMLAGLAGLAAGTDRASAQVDLRDWLPAHRENYYATMTGVVAVRYVLTADAAAFQPLYKRWWNQKRPGRLYNWKKDYLNAGRWETFVHQILFVGDDKSVIEVGGWRQTTAWSGKWRANWYRDRRGRATGLIWAPPGGLTAATSIAEMKTSGGWSAYSRTGLIERLAEYTPPYGRCADGSWAAGCGRTYADVVHLVMYHGTKNPRRPRAWRCYRKARVAASGAYYAPYKDYNTYAIELWLARGVGIIEHDRPFFEKEKGSRKPCQGYLFEATPARRDAWNLYIDEKWSR